MKTSTFAAVVLSACIATASPITVKRAGTTYTGGTTANDVTNGVCAPLTLIFARGTSEPGNMGSSVGPALAKQLISDLGASQIAVQGVTYPASVAGNAQLGAQGGPTMASLAEQALQQCPTTKVVLSGYSQGGLVTHYAVQQGGLPAADVSAIVAFGDPEYGSAFGSVPASKVDNFCAAGDGVCQNHAFQISAAHLSYTSNGNIQTGAKFIETTTGVKKA